MSIEDFTCRCLISLDDELLVVIALNLFQDMGSIARSFCPVKAKRQRSHIKVFEWTVPGGSVGIPRKARSSFPTKYAI